MKLHRFWLTLLLAVQFAMVFSKEHELNCDDVRTIGNYSKNGKNHALTITPLDTNVLDVLLNIPISKKIEPETKDQGIQIYVSLDGEADCDDVKENDSINGAFWISNQIEEQRKNGPCEVNFTWTLGNSPKLIVNNFIASVDVLYEKPYQASIELRKTTEGYSMHLGTAQDGTEKYKMKVPKGCWNENKDHLDFILVFDKKRYCGIQLEMSTDYWLNGIDNCESTNASFSGSSIASSTVISSPAVSPTVDSSVINGSTTPLPISTTTTTEGNAWKIALGVIVGIIVIAIILVVIFIVYRRRRKDPEEDAELGPNAKEDKTAEEVNDEDKTAEEANDEGKTGDEPKDENKTGNEPKDENKTTDEPKDENKTAEEVKDEE